MNKTVNINLAGVFFHIDEDAYTKLQNYLEAIKRSLSGTQGREEILADIEARIAELFSERIQNQRQVISSREVDEVIAIMGQPEDYMVDEEMFEDEKPQRSVKAQKQLFRDTENSYVGGVSSGLAHYLGIRAIWIRLLWILLTIFSTGAFILIYVALWIFVPEAKTTADKLAMRGEEVNISNIERKIREGYDDVAEKVKSVDYEKYGKQAKSGASSAATGIGSAIGFILKIIGKLIGVLLLLISGSTLIGLFIALFTVGTFGLMEAPWTDYVEISAIGAPLWLLSLLTFFAIAIPFFFLFILGLKILVKKLKSIGTPAKLVLLGVWLLSVIGLSVIGIHQTAQRAFDGEVVQSRSLPVTPSDTLFLSMQYDPQFASSVRKSGLKVQYDENDRKVIYTTDVAFTVQSTTDSVGRIQIVKTSLGSDPSDAKNNAEEIEYELEFQDNKLLLNSFLTTNFDNHMRDQKVRVTVYLPVGSTLYTDRNVRSFHRYNSSIMDYGEEGQYLKITENAAICETCPPEESDSWEEDSWDEEGTLKIRTTDGDSANLEIKVSTEGLEIKENGVKNVRIDKNGIKIREN